MASRVTRPVAVVTGGKQTHSAFLSIIRKLGSDRKEWKVVDLRETLVKNPAHSVEHGVDGEAMMTQMAVVGQESFPFTIQEVLHAVMATDVDKVWAHYD